MSAPRFSPGVTRHRLLAIRVSLAVALGVAPLPGTPGPLDAAGRGRWTPDRDWKGAGGDPHRYAVHMALIPSDGVPHHSRVLWFHGEEDGAFLGGQWGWRPGCDDCVTYADSSCFKDLSEGSSPPLPGMDPFCGATTLLDNRLLSVGGTSPLIGDYGEKQARIFTPGAGVAFGSWSDPGSMASWRWYPTTVHLRDQGRILAVAGSQHRSHKMFGLVKNGSNQSSPDADLLRRQQPVPFGTWDAPVYPLLQGSARPAARVGHSTVEMTKVTRFFGDVMFGGRNASGAPLNDVWRLETRKNHPGEIPALMWCPEAPSVPDGTPPARSDHTMIRTPHPARPIVVFGGLGGDDVPRNDVWRLMQHPDSAAKLMWRRMDISGNPPAARYGHTAIYDATLDSAGIMLERIIVFGGAEGASSDPTDLRVHELRFDPSDPNAATWHEMVVVPIGSSLPPAPRLWHSLTVDSTQRAMTSPAISGAHVALMFGGKRTGSLYSDSLWGLWIMKNRRVGWELRATAGGGTRPSARARHSAVLDPEQNNRLYVYGGEGASGPADSYLDAINTWDPYDSVWKQWTDMGFTLSGHTATLDLDGQNVRAPEVYDDNATGNRWFRDTSAPLEQSSYPFVFMVPGATDGKSRIINLHKDTLLTYRLEVPPTASDAGAWQQLTNAPLPFRPECAVQYRPGKLMMAGGGLRTGPRTGLTYTLDTSDLSNSWVAADSMTPRWHHNLVLLPTGQVLAVGGNDHLSSATEGPTRRPQLWTPNGTGGGTWTGYANASDTLAEQPTARTYHSTAVLLPDGRVLSAGGETPNDKYVANLYCPPYLYKSDGETLAARPTITGAPAATTWGSAFTICVADTASIRSACLMRPGATTHGVDMNQSFVPLSILAQKGSPMRLHLATPSASDVAPPGDYLLFVLGSADGADVPSIARWVRVNSSTTPAPDELELTADLITCESIGPLRWAAPADGGCSGKAQDYDLRYSLAPITSSNFSAATPLGAPDPATGGTSQTSYVVTGISAGTQVYFAGRTRSTAGHWSPLATAEFATLTSCGGGGAGASAERTRGEGEAANDPTAPARGATALRGPAERHALTSTASTVRLVAGHAGGAEPRWQLTIEDFAQDPARLAATERAMVNESWSEAEGWVADAATPLPPGRAGVRALPGIGRLVLPAGATLESVVLAPRRYALARAVHSRLGDLVGAADGSAAADFAAGDTLTIDFGPATSAGEGEDCLFVVRVPGVALASGARSPSRGPASGREPVPGSDAAPAVFALHPVRPNPFASSATIGFDLPRASRVRIEIFDVQGRRVARLLDESRPAGRHAVSWNGRRASGAPAGPGVYLCRMIAPGFTAERRVTMVP